MHRLIFRFEFLLAFLFAPAWYAAAATGTSAIASAHPLATAAGHEIIQAGGNAFDAAIAVSATLAVVEPSGSGLGGGGLFLLHRAKDGYETMIDAREQAPGAAHRNMYLDEKGDVVPGLSVNGPMSAAIPGLVAGLIHLGKQYGRLPLAKSLAPAIRAAREGFEVDPRFLRLAKFRLPVLRQYPSTSAIFLVENDLPVLHHRLQQRDLADTLERVGTQGMAGFYNGEMAQKLVQGVRRAGGIWTLDDLNSYKIVEREPIRGEYRGYRITSASPPSSGGIVLVEALNILSGFPLDQYNGAERKHLIAESMRRAYRDRAQYLGDPDFVRIPTEKLTHPWYAAGLRSSIRIDQASSSQSLAPVTAPQGEGHHTSHLSILDHEGNRVSATLTINYAFGSGFVVPGTGVLLNDEMDDFSSKPGKPNVYGLVGAEANAIAPGKRPLSSMTPSFIEGERGLAIIGTPGGSRIISMVMLGMLEYIKGASAEDIVGLARFHHQYLPDHIQFEPNALSGDERDELNLLGHTLKPLNKQYGNMQVVLQDAGNARMSAASDPRGEGHASVK